MALFGSKWSSESDQPRPAVVADCEAFLLGHLAEWLVDQGSGVPVWAWVNLLAHGSYEELRSEVSAQPGGRFGVRDWKRSRAYLAAEVLAIADGTGPLLTLQEAALRPLECELAESPEVNRWSPSTLASHVNTALAAQRALEHNPMSPVRREGRSWA